MTVLISATVGLLLSIGVHLVFSRAHVGLVRSYAASFMSGIFAIAATGIVRLQLVASEPLSWVATAFLLYVTWWFIFLNLVQALESSIRVRILHEICAAGGKLSRQTLLGRYNDERLVQLRVERLLSSRAVIARGDHLFVNSAGLRVMARFFRLLKLAILGRRSEFS